jgi:hypothetical protein
MKKLSTKQGNQGGQEYHANWYCPTCHVFSYMSHISGCKDKKVKISATARIPRKNASKKVWDDFYKKFVLKEDIKFIKDKKAKDMNAQYEKSVINKKPVRS